MDLHCGTLYSVIQLSHCENIDKSCTYFIIVMGSNELMNEKVGLWDLFHWQIISLPVYKLYKF